MTNFPTSLDDDTTLPIVNDNINEIGAAAINAVRDATFAIEQNIGVGAQGSTPSIADRLGVSIDAAGALKSSAITGLGLVTLPITSGQIDVNAAIPESKLLLDHASQDLFNLITVLSVETDNTLFWISNTGVKLNPHIAGTNYRHTLDQIDVNANALNYLGNNLRTLRNNTNSYLAVKDMNAELLAHQWADGSPFGTIKNITTNNGSTYPNNYAHTASAIFLNTSRFATVPQTASDLQLFADFMDSASTFLLGGRNQNLSSNGISRESRSSSLGLDGYGSPIVPVTTVTAYLLNTGGSSSPVDDIDNGDDIIEFKPSAGDMSSFSFDEKFALVKIGDIIRINYGTVEVKFIIKEKKYIQSPQKYVVRIAGKNLAYTTTGTARIDRPLVNNNKSGVLALAAANGPVVPSSLIVVNPRSAQALGIGFNPAQFDTSHYMLYLAMYPSGYPQDGYIILPPIDITGNQGATPGLYTLSSIVETTNNAFRQAGYNYRFVAYQHQGEFGVAMADSYNNAGFSILSAVVSPSGTLDSGGTAITFQNNVVGMFSAANFTAPDPLGLGPLGANIASPAFQASYGSAAASQYPTKLFLPLKRNNYYVNGTERETVSIDIGQTVDGYGDGYWVGTIILRNPSAGRVETTYEIQLDLSTSKLKVGKTIVVQKLGTNGSFPTDFGRFIIKTIEFGCLPNNSTKITVYDAVHGASFSPVASVSSGTVAIYFDSDSLAFNAESATDFSTVSPFKRHFETYVDDTGNTFTHERGRFYASAGTLTVNTDPKGLTSHSELIKINLVKISPKLRGYQFGTINKITLNMISLDGTTGAFDGYLSSWDGTNATTHPGPLTAGKIGEIVRFYDETHIDYIDIIFDANVAISSLTNQHIDIQLFPTLSLDNEVMMIGTFQYNTVTNIINYLVDERQFGNISEKDFSTSAFNFFALPEKLLHGNGVIRGFDLATTTPGANPNAGQIFLTGGQALVNGKFVQLNNETVVIPTIKETPLYNINWVVCVNSNNELQIIPLLDYDPALNTPSNSNRIFNAFNLVNGQHYNLDASTFSDIINNRKDLTPLYIVASITTPGSGITPPSISLSITDARKYVNDVDTNLPLRLTAANAQGNFKSPVSILNWIKYNNIFNGTAIVKGADAGTGVINAAINLDFASTVTIDGENDALLTFNGAVTLGSNLTFKNLDLSFLGGIALNPNAQNLTFENCTITINIGVSSPSANNVIFDFVTSNNVNIIDTAFNIVYSPLINPPSPVTDITKYGAVFRLTNSTNFTVSNSSVAVTFATTPGATVPGDMFVLIGSNGVTLKDSDFTGNFNRFIGNSNSNSLRLNNLNVTSSYNPLISVADLGFSAANFVNSGQGYIYSNVTGTLNDIVLDNVVFNYSPASSANSNRFSFINFELSSTSSMLSNLSVTNCKFNNTNFGGATEDVRAAIAIINTYSAYGSATLTSSQQPILLNAKIEGNVCNRNQSIIITSRLDSNNIMSYPGLTAQNCVIRDNICGTIGYWTSSSTKIVSIVPNANALTDKNSGLTIENNLCHLITNVDHTGNYFLVSKITGLGASINQCQYPSGYTSIKGNRCNWIHTGISFEESSSLQIIGNSLAAYDQAYLTQFNDVSPNVYGPSTGYAIFVSANKHVTTSSQLPGEGNSSAVLISGNIVGTGYWFQATLAATTYKYNAGYIFSQSSSIITHNILKGVNTTGGFLILAGGVQNTITNNQIFRGTSSCTAYVAFNNYDIPQWDSDSDGLGGHSAGTIVENYFDSPFISDASLDENVISLPAAAHSRWMFERNKNQTGYAYVPLTNQAIFNGRQFLPPLVTASPASDTYASFASDTSSPVYFGGWRSQFLRIVDNDVAATYKWAMQENIEKHLPTSVRLIALTAGLRPFESVVAYSTSGLPATAAATSNFYLNVARLEDAGTSTSDLTNTDFFSAHSSPDTSIAELNANVYTLVTGGQINATTGNIPFSINFENYGGTDISYNYITGRGKSVSLSTDFRWTRTSGTMHVIISPIKIKYRW